MKKNETLVTLLSCSILFAATFAVLSGVLNNEFYDTWDDGEYVLRNLAVNSGVSFASIKRMLGMIVADNWHPVTLLSHMLDVQFFGLNPRYHHLSNLLLHCANVVLIYLFFVRTTRNLLAAFLVALIFGVHPLHVESVAWLSERKDLLSTFFILAASYLYSFYAVAEDSGKKAVLFIAVCGLHLLGLMSKSMVITFPLLLLAFDYWPLHRFERTSVKNLFFEKLPLFLLSTAFVLITLITQSEKELNSIENVLIAAYSYCHHFIAFVFPYQLSYLYSYSLKPVLPVLALTACAASLFLFLLFKQCQAKQMHFAISGFLIYIVLYFPVSGIVRIGRHLYADRYMYLPMLGLCMVFVYGMCLHYKKVLYVIPLFIAFYCYTTFAYVKTWDSYYDMNMNAIAVKSLGIKDYARANTYFSHYHYQQGNQQAALAYLHKALVKSCFYSDRKLASLEGESFYSLKEYAWPSKMIDSFFIAAINSAYTRLVYLYMNNKEYQNARIAISNGLAFQPGNEYLLNQQSYLHRLGIQ